MKNITNKFIKTVEVLRHFFEGIYPIIKTMTKVFLIMFSVLLLTEDFYNRLSPSELWFEYHPPKVVVVDKGELPSEFHSNAEIKQTTRLIWEDTLSCIEPDGNYKKYNTQIWVQTKLPRGKDEPTKDWAYNYMPEKTGNRTCQMCGVIIGKSRPTIFNPNGYNKIDDYCTEEFIY